MTQPAGTRREALETVVGTVIGSLLWAVLLNSILELLMTGGDFKRLFSYTMYTSASLFVLDSLVVWVIVLLVLATIGRLWLTFAITLGVTLVIGLVNHQKLALRHEPLYPSDVDFLRSPSFLIEMSGWLPLIAGVVALVVVGAGLLFVGRRVSRTFKPIRRAATPRAWAVLGAGRALTLAFCVACLAQLSSFNAQGNVVKEVYDARGAQWAWWSQQVNYQRNGVVAGLLYNLHVPPMDVPAGYSRASMDALARKYGAIAKQVNKTRDPRALDDLNVVLVLSEAFTDPTVIRGVEIDKDPIPYTRALMDRTTSGQMLAQLMGGGTANMEYELLTGLSLADYQPQLVSPYQMLVPKSSAFPSAVGYFRDLGHRTIAIHPYRREFYHRDDVYPILGFDEFVDEKKMQFDSRLKNSEFISDEAAFDEVLAELDDSSAPVFLNLVTMQNHYSYDPQFDKEWPVEAPGDLRKDLARYATGLNYTDGALAEFLGKLSSSSEKTAVVFYGDHQPAIWPDDLVQENGEPAMKTTPYFVWTNFPTSRIPTPELVSPTQFLPLLFDQVNAEKPPFYVLLDRLREVIPAREQGVAYDAEGRLVAAEDLSPEAEELLRDYQLVLYDLSVGERYSQATMFYDAETTSAATGNQG
ncbi:MAG TPA: LTA synthase family protein [Nocardioidaceae bacterium]|nr:LTA synthase family protein [Nocardioidaceae bacterium]